MMKIWGSIWLATIALAAACAGGGTDTNTDAVAPDASAPKKDGGVVSPPDAGSADAALAPDSAADSADLGNAPDAAAADAEPKIDAGAPDSGPPQPAACSAGALLDLNRAGTRTGSTTSYLGHDDGAPPNGSVQAPSCSAAVGHEIVFAYVPYSTTKLAISTDYTDTSTDTVIWALDRCAGGMATELGCNDDAWSPPMPKASTFVTDVIPSGAPIYIVVAGLHGDHGAFHLSVRELSAVAPNGACDLSDVADYCAAGSHCLATGVGPSCVLDGTLGAVCRATGEPCDPNMACNGAPGDFGARCIPLVGLGAPCDPMQYDNRCAPPNQCSTATQPPTCTAAPYSESQISMPQFVDACAMGTRISALLSATGASPRDDGHSAAPVMIPFPFTFFGATETELWPDTNGYLLFGATEPHDLVGGPAAVPEPTEGALIAPLFEDLLLEDSPAGDLCYAALGSAPNRRLVVEWLGAYPYGAATQSAAGATFEVILWETTNAVDFIYQDLHSAPADAAYVDGREAAIEIQSAHGERYAAHRGAIASGQGLRFVPR